VSRRVETEQGRGISKIGYFADTISMGTRKPETFRLHHAVADPAPGVQGGRKEVMASGNGHKEERRERVFRFPIHQINKAVEVN
jgi:hypothetical protein